MIPLDHGVLATGAPAVFAGLEADDTTFAAMRQDLADRLVVGRKGTGDTVAIAIALTNAIAEPEWRS